MKPFLRTDPFVLAIIATVILASLLPCQGESAVGLRLFTKFAIGLLFFLHGAKLSRAAVLAGLGHGRLHMAALAATYVLFPIFGLALAQIPSRWLDPALAQGFLYLSLLPSTVQSSIAFTSIAGGNVPAAVCAASASNLLGVFLTPVLVGVTMGIHGTYGSLSAVTAIIAQLLLPFLAGHALRSLIGDWVDRHKSMLNFIDRGSIILVVYTAFSAAVVDGLWSRISADSLALVVALALVLLFAVLAMTRATAQRMELRRADEIVLVFCGSKKSLASGVPMASILFPAASVGLLILPLMIFHQIQLMVCAFLARRYAAVRLAPA